MILTLDNDVSKADGYHKDLHEFISRLRRDKYHFVTTNGCFDMLHVGHLSLIQHCLQECRNLDCRPKYSHLSTVLIVLINTDLSVDKLKSGRPVLPWCMRAEMVDALKGVGYVLPLRESTPSEMLEIIRPTIHVKDETYKHKVMTERSIVEGNGGQISFAPLKAGVSTTNIMRSILDRFELVGNTVVAKTKKEEGQNG